MRDADGRDILEAELRLRRDRAPSAFAKAVWQLVHDARYAAYPVPIVISDPPGSPGRMGRLPCDLMGTGLFAAG